MAGDAVRPSAPLIMDVSVVMPVRNGMPHLAVQLDALARQTYQGRWEVIISDNGSTDDSADAVRAVADRVPLRVIDSRDAPGRRGHARRRPGRRKAGCCCSAIVTTSPRMTGSTGWSPPSTGTRRSGATSMTRP